jgi:hypothetical protein
VKSDHETYAETTFTMPIQETRAQHEETRAQHKETRTQYEETAGQPPAPVNGLGSKGSARVTDPAATPDRRSPVSGLPNRTTPAAAQSDADGELPSVNLVSESTCDDNSILRNEPNHEPDTLGGRGRLPQGDSPGAELAPPGARWTSQLDPSHPALVTGQGVDLQPSLQHETTVAPNDPSIQEAGGRVSDGESGDLRSGGGRGRETTAFNIFASQKLLRSKGLER